MEMICSELPNDGGKPYDAAVASSPSAASIPAAAAEAAEEGRDPSPTNHQNHPHPLGSPIPTTLAPLVLRGHGDDGDDDDGEEEVRYNYSPDDDDGEDDYDDDSSEDGEIVFEIKSRKPAAAAPAAASVDEKTTTVPKMDASGAMEGRSPIGAGTCTATGASRSPRQGAASPPGQPSGTVAAKNSPPAARAHDNAVSSESSPAHAHASTTTCTATPAQPSNNDGPSTPGMSPDAAIAASSRKSRADRLAAVTGRGRQRFSVGPKSSLKKILGKIGPNSSSSSRDSGEDTGSGDAITSTSDSGSGSPDSANADAASTSSSPASASSKQSSSSPKAATTTSTTATPAVDESVSSYFSSLITASGGGGSGGKKKKAKSSTDKKKKGRRSTSTSRSPNAAASPTAAAAAAPSPNSSSSSSSAAATRDDNVHHAAAAADGAKESFEDAKSEFTEFSDSTPLVTPRLPEDGAPVVGGAAVVANAEGSPEVSPLATPPVEDGTASDHDVETKSTPPTLPNVGTEEKEAMAAVDINVQTNAASIASENPTSTSKSADGASPAPTKPNALLSGLSTNYSPSLHMPKYSENELNTKIDNAIRKAEREWRQNAKEENENAMASELEVLRKLHRSEMERIYREHQAKLDEEKKLFQEKIAEAAKNKGSLGELQTKIESFKLQMEQDKAKYRSDLEKIRADKEQEIEGITSECEKVFIECEERITGLEQQLDKKKKTVEGLSESVSDARTEKLRLEGQLEQNEAELEKVKLQIEEDRAAALMLEEKIARMQANHKSKLCLAHWFLCIAALCFVSKVPPISQYSILCGFLFIK